MARAALVLVLVAAPFAGADLAHKAVVETALHNPRPAAVMGALGVVALVWAGAVVAVRSLPLAAAAGVLLGGVAGNVVSVALWPGVPDPLVAGTIAYNLADVFIAVGLVATVAAAAAVAVRNRRLLRAPVRLLR